MFQAMSTGMIQLMLLVLSFQSFVDHYMSRPMGKLTICIGKKKKAQISFTLTAKLISAFVFATWIVQFLFYLNPKFQASSSFRCLYSPVCVGPVRKPHCWFSQEAAHMQNPAVVRVYGGQP